MKLKSKRARKQVIIWRYQKHNRKQLINMSKITMTESMLHFLKAKRLNYKHTQRLKVKVLMLLSLEPLKKLWSVTAAPNQKQSKRETDPSKKPAAAQIKDTSSVDLSRLATDIMYQFEVRDTFGEEILAELMEKAHNKAMSQPDTAEKEA